MKKILLTLALLSSVAFLGAQTNLIPDGDFEIGYIQGDNDDYYYFDGITVLRAWPYIGFELDTENPYSGSRSVRVAYRDYGLPQYDPTFRTEAYPALEDATYRLSFFYKTNYDVSDFSFDVNLNNGVQGASTTFKNVIMPVSADAVNDWVEFVIEFETGTAMASFIPYFRAPFIGGDTTMTFDEFKLVKLVTEPGVWGPSPSHEATEISTASTLSWEPGVGAAKFNLYMGTASDALELVAENLTEMEYAPSGLEAETQYFWRVDEFDGSDVVTPGPIWSFTTMNFYEDFMSQVKNTRIVSDDMVTWKQFGPGNSGYVNFLRYHPLLPDFCVTSPDMFNTYQTEDNGESWKTIKDHDGTAIFSRLYDMYYSTKTPSFAIAIEMSRLFVSNDTARSWEQIMFCPWYNNDADGDDTRSWYKKISAVAIDPADDDTWYIGAGNQARGQTHLAWSTNPDPTAANPRGSDSDYMGIIWKTTDAGVTWTEITNGLEAKAQFNRIIVHPVYSDTVFASSNYGLFRSADAGLSWEQIGDTQLDNNTIMNMDYYYDEASGEFILYLIDQVRYYPDGTTVRCDGGIFKSEDSGDTWENINGDIGLDINRLTGGVSYNFYQYIAKWLGITLAQAQANYPDLPTDAVQYFNSLNVDPSQPDALYVGFHDAQIQNSFTPGRLWKTTNDGGHWINVARDFGPAWAADSVYWKERGNPFNDNLNMGHYPTTQQWNSNYPLRSLRHCAVNTRGDVMILFAHNTLVSTDGGETFNQVDENYTANGNIMGRGNSNLPGQCLHQDKRLGEGVGYFGSGEHKLWKSTTDGTEGRQAAKFLENSQESVLAIATHPWNEDVVYTTSMRQKHLDRIYKSSNGGITFEDWGRATLAEEWMKTNYLRIDPVNPQYMYFAVTEVAGSGGGSGTDGPDANKEGGFHKSTDSGKTFNPSNNGIVEWAWVKDIEFDPRDDTRASLFTSAPWNYERRLDGGLYHSTDRGANWTEIVVAPNLEGINNIVFDHTGRLYATAGRRAAAHEDGGLFYSDDYGTTWTKIFEGGFIENVDVSPFDHNILIISNGILTQNPGIFVSTDRGETWTKNNRILGQPDKVTQVEFDLHDETTIWMSVIGSGFYRGSFPEAADSRKITVTPGTTELDIYENLQLSVDAPEFGTNVVYKSANPSVASVSTDGVVTGNMRGACKIWVTSEDGRYSDFVYVVVSATELQLVEVSPADTTINTGETMRLRIQTYQGLDPESLNYIVRDTAVLDMDASGLITAKMVGSSYVVAISDNGLHSDSSYIEVYDPQGRKIIPHVDSIGLYINDTYQLTADYTPDIVVDQITFASDDATIASVDASGMVTALQEGKTKVKFEYSFGFDYTAEVIVNVTDTTVNTHAYRSEKMQLYPNPAKDVLYTNLPGSGDYVMTITAVNGQTALIQKDGTYTGQQIEVPVSKLKGGVYVLKVVCGDGIYVKQFVKVRQ